MLFDPIISHLETRIILFVISIDLYVSNILPTKFQSTKKEVKEEYNLIYGVG